MVKNTNYTCVTTIYTMIAVAQSERTMTNTIPRIAVSILNYNSAPSTIACVQSLMNAEEAAKGSYRLDLYVSDNASSDEDQQQLQHAISLAPNVHFKNNSKNLGFAAGHNSNLRTVFSQPHPDYIWILNNDCIVAIEAPGELLKCAQNDSHVGIWGATLLEVNGQTIQCAGGCTYNSWISSFKQFGKGTSLSELEKLKTIDFDYISGASLFFPLATFQDGLRSVTVSSSELQTQDTQWLNECFFLFFEELDLAKRLAPGLSLGWAKDALIVHEGGASTGARQNQRTSTAEYHSSLSALKFTSLYYPGHLWFTAPARFILKSLLLLFTGQYQLLKPLKQAYRDFRSNKAE